MMTTNLSAVELLSMAEENFEDPKYYFGDEAKEDFWDLYKSERRFKDYNTETDEIKDPRFAYLKTCKELKVFPKASMLIKEKNTGHIDYTNVLLLNKSAVAVAEAFKRYALKVNSINLTNNGLKAKECSLMIESFSKHYQMIQTLTISKNKMGFEGAKYLAGALPEMKILGKLVIADNDIGDHGINEIIVACKNYCSIEYLDISGNNLGKSSGSMELAQSMQSYLSNNRTLEVLKVNWNSLRGAVADKIMDGLLECYGLRELQINNNLLGVSYDDKQPPVNRMAELL
jgi:Ran GTPase-activating protein (RanGAP) involved in mRNA processing and transport